MHGKLEIAEANQEIFHRVRRRGASVGTLKAVGAFLKKTRLSGHPSGVFQTLIIPLDE